MEAVQVQQIISKDGEIVITGLPYRKGQTVEVTVVPRPATSQERTALTVGQLRRSGLIGLWRDRTDIEDSAVYARRLRNEAQTRSEGDHDITGH